MKRTLIAITSLGAAAVLGLGLSSDLDVMSKRRSCGYHCSPDGGHVTPAAPPTTVQVQLVGRVNVHSGGRLHGSANKRVGCGGCPGHAQ